MSSQSAYAVSFMEILYAMYHSHSSAAIQCDLPFRLMRTLLMFCAQDRCWARAKTPLAKVLNRTKWLCMMFSSLLSILIQKSKIYKSKFYAQNLNLDYSLTARFMSKSVRTQNRIMWERERETPPIRVNKLLNIEFQSGSCYLSSVPLTAPCGIPNILELNCVTIQFGIKNICIFAEILVNLRRKTLKFPNQIPIGFNTVSITEKNQFYREK